MPEDRTLRFVENGRDLSVTNEKGETSEYRVDVIRSVHFEACKLALVVHYVSGFLKGPTEFRPGPSIIGKARLRKDSFSVIGEAGTATREFELSILRQSPDGEREYQESLESAGEKRDFQYNANIFVMRADKAFGWSDSWQLQLRVPEATFDDLADALTTQRLTSFSFRLQLFRGAYVETSVEQIGPAARVDFYLCPRKGSGPVRYPEASYGDITGWTLRTAELDLVPPDPEKGHQPIEALMKASQSAVIALSDAVANLHRIVRFGAWLLSVAVIVGSVIVAFRR